MKEALKDLYEKSKTDDRFAWTSEPETAELLAALIKMTGAKNVVEVGTFKGFTSAYMIDAIPEDGKLITIDIESFIDKEILKLIKACGKPFKIITGDSLEVLPTIKETIDLIFIDGKHEFPHLIKEVQLCEAIIRKGGIIALHDSLLIEDVIKYVKWLKWFSYFEIISLPTPDIDGRGGASGLTLIKCLNGR